MAAMVMKGPRYFVLWMASSPASTRPLEPLIFRHKLRHLSDSNKNVMKPYPHQQNVGFEPLRKPDIAQEVCKRDYAA
jgi:hypothetical protein